MGEEELMSSPQVSPHVGAGVETSESRSAVASTPRGQHRMRIGAKQQYARPTAVGKLLFFIFILF